MKSENYQLANTSHQAVLIPSVFTFLPMLYINTEQNDRFVFSGNTLTTSTKFYGS